MEAKDQDAGRVAADAEGQATPGDPGSSGGPGGQENPARNSSGEAGAVAREAPQPGPRGDALPGPSTTPLGLRRLQFSLIVSFRTPLLAQMALQLLAPVAGTHTSAVELELTVSNHLLTFRLTGEDPVQLLVCLSTCLHEFCMMMQTLERIALPFFPKNRKLGKRGLN